MDINELAQQHILKQPLYVTGKPIAYTAREFGLDPKDIDKLASNENPFGPSPKGMAEARKALEEVNLYPDGGSYDLIGKIAEFRGVNRDQIAVGNGSNELLDMIAQVFLGPGTEAVMGNHSFAVYKLATMAMNAKIVEVDMPAPGYNYNLKAMRDAVNEKTRIVFLANPNNPTGSDLTAKEILDFADSLPETCVLVMDGNLRSRDGRSLHRIYRRHAGTRSGFQQPHRRWQEHHLLPYVQQDLRSCRPPRGLLHHPSGNRRPHQPRA